MAHKPSGNAYWASQIGCSALFAVGTFVAGVAILADDETEPGKGVMCLLVSILFLVTTIWLIRQFAKSNKTQRAIYAWAIMQQQGHRLVGSIPANDVQAMAAAARARDGKMTPEELADLQAMRPDVPYPGDAASLTPLAQPRV